MNSACVSEVCACVLLNIVTLSVFNTYTYTHQTQCAVRFACLSSDKRETPNYKKPSDYGRVKCPKTAIAALAVARSAGARRRRAGASERRRRSDRRFGGRGGRRRRAQSARFVRAPPRIVGGCEQPGDDVVTGASVA